MRWLVGLFLGGLAVAFGSTEPALGQSGYDRLGSARAAGLGHASAALTSAVGVHANPAGSALRERRGVSFFARQSFGLSALRYGSAAGVWPARWGAVLGGASTFGGGGYREVHYSLGYARAFQLGTTRSVYAGLLGRYYHTRIDGYGGAGAAGVHLGVLLPLLPTLYLGAHATNVNAPALTDGEPLPQTLAVGLQYRVRPSVRVVGDVFKDLSFPASVRGGLEVRPLSALALRAGVTSAPVRFTGGVGLRLGRLHAHVAAEQHNTLGWSPSAALEVYW
jgi:hypothetical protein